MSDTTKKPANNIGREDSAGQNPFWPGEDIQEASKNPLKGPKDGEETTIPLVDSVPHKPNTET